MPRTFVPLVVACWLALLVVPLIGQLDRRATRRSPPRHQSA